MTTLGSSTTAQDTLTTTSVTTIYTAGAGSKEEQCTIIFINTDSVSRTLDLFSGGSADVNRLVGQAVTIQSKGMLVLESSLAANEDIRAQASVANKIVWTRKARIVA